MSSTHVCLQQLTYRSRLYNCVALSHLALRNSKPTRLCMSALFPLSIGSDSLINPMIASFVRISALILENHVGNILRYYYAVVDYVSTYYVEIVSSLIYNNIALTIRDQNGIKFDFCKWNLFISLMSSKYVQVYVSQDGMKRVITLTQSCISFLSLSLSLSLGEIRFRMLQ